MRTLLLIVAIGLSAGCSSGTGGVKRTATNGSSHDVPVVTESPTLSDRHRADRLREAEEGGIGMTVVGATVTR